MLDGNVADHPNFCMQGRQRWDRRRFVGSAAAVAGSAALFGYDARLASAEPPPETKRLRLVQIPSICQAPQYVAEQLLQDEGFTDVQYLKKPGATKGIEAALASGEADTNMHLAGPLIMRLDAGDPVVILAGGHVGCFELFATERVRAIRDLKGKTVSLLELGSSQHVFLSSMLAYVGLDPNKDVHFETHPSADSIQLLADGKVDAFLGFPPEPQEMRARKIGHLVVNSSVDQPLVAVLLLHGGGEQRVCSQKPGGYEACAAGDLESNRHLRCRTRPVRSAAGGEGICEAAGLRYASRERHPLQQVARTRSGRHDSLLRTPPA